MGFVDYDSEAPAPMRIADLVEDEGELLYGGDNDLLTTLDEAPKVARALGMPYCGPNLRELFDGVADLFVEDDAVSNNDNGTKRRLALLLDPDELMREPCD